MAKKSEKKDKRKSREYVGEEIETGDKEGEIIQSGDEQAAVKEEGKKEKGGGLKDLFTKKEKMLPVYQCPGCTQPEDPEEMIGFKTNEELTQHLEEVHNVKMIPEEVERCKIEVLKPTAEKIFKGMEETAEKLMQEEAEQQKRFEMALITPPELEPKEIVKLGEAKNPEEVYSKTIQRVVAPKDAQALEDEEVYQETISGEIIQVTMVKSFHITPQVLAALHTLKMAM